MEEIKAPITDRIKRFIGTHIAMIGLVLFCVVLFFSSCGRAKAAEPISPYEIQYLEDLMQTWDTYPDNTPVDFTSLYSQFESDCISNPYYVTNNSNYIIMCKKPSFGLVSVYDSSYDALEAAFNVSEYPNWQDSFPFIIYQTYSPSSNWRVVIRFVVSDFNGGMTLEPMRFSWTGNMVYSKTDYTRITYYNSTQFPVSNTSWYGNVDSFYRCNGSRGTGYSTGWSVSQLSVTPIQIPYSEDSRLKFSTSLRGDGEKLLNTDLSDFLSWSPTSGMTVSDLVLTLDCDGTEVEVELDDANSEIIFVKYPMDYSYRCVYITPYSELGLDEYEDVSIVKCDFTRTYTHLGPNSPEVEDFHIACNYLLKNETAPIEPDVITPPVYDDTEVKTDAQIEDLVEYLNNQSSYSFDGQFTLQSTLDNLPIWADVFSNTLTRMDDDSPYFAGHWYDHNPFVFGDSQIDITEYLLTTIVGAAEYYDVMYFPVYGWYYDGVQGHGDGWSTGLKGYIIFYTQRYFERQSSLTLLDILSVIQNQTQNDIYRTQYIIDKLDDFEDKSLDGFNTLIGLDRTRNSWLSSLNAGLSTLNQTSYNGFVDVVDAINDIDIPVPTPFDDDDILTALANILDKLGDIIDNQNSTQDGFTPLIAWVKDNESVNGIYTWVNAMMHDNILSSTFDVFSLDDLDPDQTGLQNYLFFSESFFSFATGQNDGFGYFSKFYDNTINFNDWNGGYTGWGD